MRDGCFIGFCFSEKTHEVKAFHVIRALRNQGTW